MRDRLDRAAGAMRLGKPARVAAEQCDQLGAADVGMKGAAAYEGLAVAPYGDEAESRGEGPAPERGRIRLQARQARGDLDLRGARFPRACRRRRIPAARSALAHHRIEVAAAREFEPGDRLVGVAGCDGSLDRLAVEVSLGQGPAALRFGVDELRALAFEFGDGSAEQGLRVRPAPLFRRDARGHHGDPLDVRRRVLRAEVLDLVGVGARFVETAERQAALRRLDQRDDDARAVAELALQLQRFALRTEPHRRLANLRPGRAELVQRGRLDRRFAAARAIDDHLEVGQRLQV